MGTAGNGGGFGKSGHIVTLVSSLGPSWTGGGSASVPVWATRGGEELVLDHNITGRTGEARGRLDGEVRSTTSLWSLQSRVRLAVDRDVGRVVVLVRNGLDGGDCGGLGVEP